jgi:hypothetical protein
MASDSIASSSRRSLLAAGLGGLIALVAQALGRAGPVRAADDEPVLVGGEYISTSVTKITNSANAEDVIAGYTTAGTAVYGQSTDYVGVAGRSFSAGAGVFGSSHFATGVHGVSDLYHGVHGASPSGRGVHGFSSSGTGVWAESTTGTAFRAEGRVRFKTSGLATIAAGTKSVVVTPGIDLTTSAKILALLQGNPGGSTAVQRVAINATADTLTIYLTANSVSDVKVSWFVIS